VFDFLYAIILGIVQGISEFLPISSSGHLILAAKVFQKEMHLTLNVALHLGTLLAVIVYFLKDWRQLLWGSFSKDPNPTSRNILFAIVVGTIPAGIIGIFFKDQIATIHNTQVVCIMLILVGVLMWVVDRYASSSKGIGDISIRHGLLIGVAQAFALIPGTSRSGITILAGRLLKLDRESAARFSFMLGTPAMGGAALLEGSNIISHFAKPEFYLGMIVSFVVGWLTISFLLRFIRTHGLGVFAVYRILVASTIIYFVGF